MMETKKSKKRTRLFAVIMTLALSLGGTVSAFALINSEGHGETDNTDITPSDVILINKSIQSTSYDKTFSTHPDHGTRLDIYVQNNSTHSVEMVVTNNDTGVSRTYKLAAGANRTNSWTNPDGIRNSYTIQVDNFSGAEMDLFITTKQY